MPLHLIAAMARDGAIGQAATLPWPALRGDMAWFRHLTSATDPERVARAYCDAVQTVLRCGPGDCYQAAHPIHNVVIMGRRTWKGLSRGTLPGRQVIVLHAHKPCPLAVYCAHDLRQALHTAGLLDAPQTFIAGGTRLYAEAMRRPDLRALFLTEVDAKYPRADTWWPNAYPGSTRFAWRSTSVSDWVTEPDAPRYRFSVWERA